MRDALGIQSAYYAFFDGGLAISTDQESLLSAFRALGLPIVRDDQALFECSVFKTATPDRPLFQNVRPLEFGTERTFVLDGSNFAECGKKVVFPLRFGGKGAEVSEAEEDAKFRRAFNDAVADLPNDGTVSVLFTGGLDSTLILDAARRMGKNRISATTVVQKGKWKTDDVFAAEYCAKYGIEHFVIETENSVFSREFDRTVGVLEEPDSVLPGLAISLLQAAEYARAKGVRTLVSGSFVEPLLGSNPSTLMGLKYLFYSGRPPVDRLLTSFERDYKEAGVDYQPFAAKSITLSDPGWYRKLTSALRDVFFSELGKFPLSLADTFAPRFLKNVDSDRNVFPNYYFGPEDKGAIYDALTYSDLVFRGNIRNNLLNQRIANASDVSIIPLFARAELRNAFISAPVEWKFDPKKYATTYSDNKYFLFRAMGADIPPEVANRKKTEASVPVFAEWILAPENASFVEAAFSELKAMGTYSESYLAQLHRFYRIKSVKRDFEFPPEFKGKASAFLNALWKAVAIATWSRRYFPSGRTE